MESRERMEVDVLFVGGGPACLSGALYLMRKIAKHNDLVERGEAKGEALKEPMIVLLEKGAEIGAHSLSGAVLDPVALKELVPDYEEQGAPIEHVVRKESLYYLTSVSQFHSPFIPPPLENRGGLVISLSRFNRWLGSLVAEAGCEIFPGFPGIEVLYEGDRVIGVRTGDKGIDKEGNRKGNFEPGIDLVARVTIFGEGPRGNLAKTLIPRLGLAEGKAPIGYLTGVKEVWELPEGNEVSDEVIHTLGHPLPPDTYGGGFIYPMADRRLILGLLAGVNSPDPFFDTHEAFQRYKDHDFIQQMISGGKLLEYGAKTVSISGYHSVPQLAFDGGLLVGDDGALFDSRRIKGVHLAMKSGMLAAEAAFSALLSGDASREVLAGYEESLRKSYVWQDLRAARNFHQAFDRGRITGMLNAAFGMVTGGKGLTNWKSEKADCEQMKKVADYHEKGAVKEPVITDGTLTFDKVTSVYHSGTTHDEDQPCHLHVEDPSICHGRCREEYGNPCVKFCPAGVYEMVADEESGEEKLRINFANCVHCKTCDIRDPYGIITWVPPEGGGGPKYTMM
ncbi:MAG: electron transfer flavoprotein-ubiquinone oxidoreductase [Deltaproteobacteria bacterium]|nr:electron transfer flavoprotein-ubiquinone oxidoreductase [Deltaproteobacteria bacterium]